MSPVVMDHWAYYLCLILAVCIGAVIASIFN